jgi:predicted nucleic acid-binding protein
LEGGVTRLYVDTSVIGGCFEPEHQPESLALFELVRAGRIILLLSELVITELFDAPPQVRQLLAGLPPSAVEVLPPSEEAIQLGQAYVDAKIVGRGASNDARHVAQATVAKADAIVSWNMRHIVHPTKIRRYNEVNRLLGFGELAIETPKGAIGRWGS